MSGVLGYFVFAGIGKVGIYLFRKFPPSRSVKRELLRELIDCDLCLGVWAYFLLALLFQMNIFVEWMPYPIIGEFLTGAVTSFVVWVFSAGWEALFGTIVLEG